MAIVGTLCTERAAYSRVTLSFQGPVGVRARSVALQIRKFTHLRERPSVHHLVRTCKNVRENMRTTGTTTRLSTLFSGGILLRGIEK